MINITNLTLKIHLTLLLDDASAQIKPKQRVGLIGRNGVGKSSLLALLNQKLPAESGEFSIPKDWKVVSVKQSISEKELKLTAVEYVLLGDRRYTELQHQLNQCLNSEKTEDHHKIAHINAELEQIDGWSINSRASALLHGLGFASDEYQNQVSEFSGGWQMRLNLAQALIAPSDLLLLDEPTNHLDLETVLWLEQYLLNYTGTLVLISHDRDFLDKICNKIIHIENYKLNEYSGNYSSFEKLRADKISLQNAMFDKQQAKIAHLTSFINRFKAKATKAKQAQSRVKALEKIELVARANIDNSFEFSFRPSERLPNPLINMFNVSVGYDEKVILDEIKLNLVPGSRFGLLGRNGQGKTTLIKLLAGDLSPMNGDFVASKGLKIGYFAQHQLESLRFAENSLWHLAKIAPEVREQELRNYLAGFNFTGDKIFQAVGSFSGGEKARLVLALIVWQRPNLLLLDEPTNHLDMDMCNALIEALLNYDGALIVVSHDKHFLNNVVDEFYLVDQGKVATFNGDIDDYHRFLLQKERDYNSEFKPSRTPENSENRANDLDKNDVRKEQRRKNAQLRTILAPLRKKEQDLDKKIATNQQLIDKLELVLSSNEIYNDENKKELKQTLEDLNKAKNIAQQLEDLWLEIQMEIEELSAENE